MADRFPLAGSTNTNEACRIDAQAPVSTAIALIQRPVRLKEMRQRQPRGMRCAQLGVDAVFEAEQPAPAPVVSRRQLLGG